MHFNKCITLLMGKTKRTLQRHFSMMTNFVDELGFCGLKWNVDTHVFMRWKVCAISIKLKEDLSLCRSEALFTHIFVCFSISLLISQCLTDKPNGVNMPFPCVLFHTFNIKVKLSHALAGFELIIISIYRCLTWFDDCT